MRFGIIFLIFENGNSEILKPSNIKTKKMNNQKLKRRNFLRNTSLGFMGAALLGKNGFTAPSQDPDYKLPKIKEYRTLGRTGSRVSDIGLGGAALKVL